MKRTLAASAVLLAGLLAAGAAQAQQPVSAPSGQQTLAATVGVYAFPAEGQSPAQQNRDEADCYSWAVNNTQSDPFQLARKMEQTAQAAEYQKEQIDSQGKGAGAKGAVAGAAAGALIGEIASNDAGGGAAWGAAVGGIAARRRSKAKKKEAAQEVEQQAQYQQYATADQIEAFKKAFSICLEAKKYLVKF